MFLVPAVIVRGHKHAQCLGRATAQASAACRPGPPAVVGLCPLSRSHLGGRPGVPGVFGRPCRCVGGTQPGGQSGLPGVLGRLLGAGPPAAEPSLRKSLPDILPVEARILPVEARKGNSPSTPFCFTSKRERGEKKKRGGSVWSVGLFSFVSRPFRD
jgi:hypothetical protein